MNKYLLLRITVIILLLADIGLVSYVLLGRPRHRNPREIVITRLKLSKEQAIQYDVLIKAHRGERDEALSKVAALRRLMYQNLVVPHDNVDSIANVLAEAQRGLEILNYNHFQDIKQLCTPAQLTQYERLVSDLDKIFVGAQRSAKRKGL
jgi:periplasmic protein CpxP/Spy